MDENAISKNTLNTNQLRELIKTAIVEILQEQKEVFTNILIEAMEDVASVKAIEEGESTETVDQEIYSLKPFLL